MGSVLVARALGYLPPGQPCPAHDLPRRTRDQVAALGLLKRGERLHYLCAHSSTRLAQHATVFTDRRVLSWRRFEGAFEWKSAAYADITGMSLSAEPRDAGRPRLELNLRDAPVWSIELNTDPGANRRFESVLRTTWLNRRARTAG